jgi:hypothetical protein
VLKVTVISNDTLPTKKMKTLFKAVSASLLALSLTSAALALPITGSVTFAGGATLDTGDVNTATAVSSWHNTFVLSTSGVFTAEGLGFPTPVTIAAPWSLNYAGPTIADFWVAGDFSFNLDSSWIVQQSGNGFLTVAGSGWINGPAGYDATAGSWSFTTQSPAGDRGVFSFSAGSASVPDGGTTAVLLGIALVGMSIIARRRSVA